MKDSLRHYRYYVASLAIGLCWALLGVQRLHSMTAAKSFMVVKRYELTGTGVAPFEYYKTYASRDDGAFAVSTGANDSRGSVVVVSLPNEQRQVVVDHEYRIKSSFAVADPGLIPSFSNRPYAGDNCASMVDRLDSYLGDATHLNVRVTIYGSGNFVTSQNRFSNITKLAPDLNCFPLVRDMIWVDEHGQIKSHTIETATEIRAGVADWAMFDIPGDLREVKPSELFAARRQHMVQPPTCPSCDAERDKRLDAIYSRANPR